MTKATRAKSPMGRLSEEQYKMLFYIFLGPKDELIWKTGMPIDWSPSIYFGRTPSKSEGVTLSRRLTGLVDRGLIKRDGRKVQVTSSGKQVLSDYSETADSKRASFVKSALLYAEDFELVSVIDNARSLLDNHLLQRFIYNPEGEEQLPLAAAKAVLDAIGRNIDAELGILFSALVDEEESL